MVPSRMVNTLGLYIGREPRVDRVLTAQVVVDLKITKMAASLSLSGMSGQGGHRANNAIQLRSQALRLTRTMGDFKG